MYFKNIRIFRLPEDIKFDSEKLSAQLVADKLKPCGPQDLATQGWLSPFNMLSDIFCWQSGAAQLIELGIEEKILPPSVVKTKLDEKVTTIKAETGNKPGRKQQTDIKQELLFELLPQAFTKLKRIGAYIDNDLKLLVVDSANQNAAENLVSQLRQTLGSFKAEAFGESSDMAMIMTRWITEGHAESGFEFGSSLVLQTMDEAKSVIRAKNVDFLNDEMQRHIDNGYLVTQIGLIFNERIELVLTHDFAIKSIKFTDIVLDGLGAEAIESEEQLLDSRFTLMHLEFKEMLIALFTLFANQVG